MYPAEYDKDIAAFAGDERVEAMPDCMAPVGCAEDFGLMAADGTQSAARPGDGMGGTCFWSPPFVRPLASLRRAGDRRSNLWRHALARVRNARRRSASPASPTSSDSEPGAASPSRGGRKLRRCGRTDDALEAVPAAPASPSAAAAPLGRLGGGSRTDPSSPS